ncbi:MAG: hypothetical protein P8L45_03565, partial [Longimicrobiales bacterium]|nr:hypothetical protein [Longimicrobiales bacterium]
MATSACQIFHSFAYAYLKCFKYLVVLHELSHVEPGLIPRLAASPRPLRPAHGPSAGPSRSS